MCVSKDVWVCWLQILFLLVIYKLCWVKPSFFFCMTASSMSCWQQNRLNHFIMHFNGSFQKISSTTTTSLKWLKRQSLCINVARRMCAHHSQKDFNGRACKILNDKIFHESILKAINFIIPAVFCRAIDARAEKCLIAYPNSVVRAHQMCRNRIYPSPVVGK